MRTMRLAPWALGAFLLAGRAWALPGNAWHLPRGAEPGIASMRDPVLGVTPGRAVRVYSGNQFKGEGGEPGNQLQTGSAVLWRRAGAADFVEAPMAFFAEAGNNKYYVAELSASGLRPGDGVEYYLRVAYDDHDTTFVYGDDDASRATADEALARAAPFAFVVEPEAEPAGDFVALDAPPWRAQLDRASGHLRLVGPGTSVTVLPALARVGGAWAAVGALAAATPAPGGGLELEQAFGAGAVRASLRFSAEGVLRYEVLDWRGPAPERLRVSVQTPGGEHAYGLGEKFNAFDQAGRRAHLTARDVAGAKGDAAYKVAPWWLSSRGHGFHFDASHEAFFDLGAGARDRFALDVLGGALRYHVVGGPAPADALARYTGYSGRPPAPPPWAFAPWVSSDHWRDGGEVRYVLTRLAELGIPGSVFVFDSPWETSYNDFTWNAAQFARGGTYEGRAWAGFDSPRAMLEFLRAHGYKAVLWLTPFVNVRSNDEGVPGQNTGKAAPYDEAAAAGLFVRAAPGGPPLVVDWWKGSGSPLDFTNPAARAWLAGRLGALAAAGDGVVGGFKADDGEGDYIPLDAAYADGRRGDEMRNGYGLEYHRAVWGVLGREGVLFARSGFTGSQAFPASWSGDNEANFGADNGLPSVVVAGLSAAMSGYAFWGHDVGGYLDQNPSPDQDDLFTRWAQFGALSPLMQLHRQVTLGRQYPWSYSPAALANYVACARLHTRLFPYLYTLAGEAERTGLPLLRPLALAWPNEPAVQGIQDEYLLGPDLLVAPVLAERARSRRVFLPPGGWYDYFSHAYHPGGGWLDWADPEPSHFPLFVRRGALLPLLGRDDVMTLVDPAYLRGAAVRTADASLAFDVYPAEAASSVALYDGTSLAARPRAGALDLELGSAPRPLSLRVFAAEPARVLHQGAPLARAEGAAALDASEAGWAVEGPFVRVKVAHAGGSALVSLEGLAAPAAPSAGAREGGCSCRQGPGREGGRAAAVAAALAALGALFAKRRRKGAA
ncbi:MAG TPA: TIM-barrel domain-containing protein [Polyangiaceae bacterium]|nr:TIM-barrel domain-containing protein [Polyangiaceae bacterium]